MKATSHNGNYACFVIINNYSSSKGSIIRAVERESYTLTKKKRIRDLKISGSIGGGGRRRGGVYLAQALFTVWSMHLSNHIKGSNEGQMRVE